MRFIGANSVFLTVQHVAGFTFWPCHLDSPSQLSSRPAYCVSGTYPLEHISSGASSRAGAPGRTLCDGRGLSRGEKSRWQRCGATSLSASTSSTADAGTVETSVRACPTGRLRLSIVGRNAEKVGFQLGQRIGLSVRSIEELMAGRRGRRTDTVKAKAVLHWLTDEEASDGTLKRTSPSASRSQINLFGA